MTILTFFLPIKVTRVLLLWVNNHFTDFETDPLMMEQLEKFEALLEEEKMQVQYKHCPRPVVN